LEMRVTKRAVSIYDQLADRDRALPVAKALLIPVGDKPGGYIIEGVSAVANVDFLGDADWSPGRQVAEAIECELIMQGDFALLRKSPAFRQPVSHANRRTQSHTTLRSGRSSRGDKEQGLCL